MSFLNKKEQVIKLELTQFGKQLLSKGKFKPEFYAFFDDDILYDSRYANFEEPQNQAQERIKNETPSIDVQYVYSGRETKVKQINEYIRAGEQTEDGVFKRLGAKEVQQTPEKHYALSAPLGTISLDAEHAPAWSINVLKGEISSSVEFKRGDHQTVKIPQLNMSPIEFRTVVEISQPPQNEDDALIQNEDLNQDELGLEDFTRKFEDGSFLHIFKNSIVLEIEEINTFFENENFDLEVFEIESEEELYNAGTREILVPLFFKNKKSEVVDGILLDSEEHAFELPEVDPSYVEYFFDVFCDDEIDPNLLCSLNPSDKPEGLFGQRVLDRCEKLVEAKAEELYTSDVTEEDLEEPC